MHVQSKGSAHAAALQKIAIATLVAITAAGIWFNLSRKQGGPAVKPLEPGGWQPTDITGVYMLGCRVHPRGNAASGYTLLEFGDCESVPCRDQAKEIDKMLRARKGRVGFDFIDFPVSGNPRGYIAALYESAADMQQAYWPLHDWIMSTPSPDIGAILKYARHLKLDIPRLEADRRSSGADARVHQNISLASKLGVNMLPSYFLSCPNGMVVRFWDAKSVEGYLDKHLR